MKTTAIDNLLDLDVDQPIDSLKGVPLGAFRQHEDGAIEVNNELQGQQFSLGYDFEINFNNERELIEKYEEMSHDSLIGKAVDEILNDMIVSDSEDAVKLDLTFIDNKEISEKIKKSFGEQFDHILNLLNFDKDGYDIVKDWFYKGKQYHYVKLNESRDSIEEVLRLDQRNVKKIRETKTSERSNSEKQLVKVIDDSEEYFLYKLNHLHDSNRFRSFVSTNDNAIKFPHNTVVYINSGIFDTKNNLVLSPIHSALRTYNQLKQAQDAAVIWRLVRAPQVRVFYVDTNNLSNQAADRHLTQFASRFKSRVQYNNSTGKVITGQKGIQSLYEDFFIPRSARGSAEIDTLDSSTAGGDLDALDYLEKQLYIALKIPRTRTDPEMTFSLGRAAEITRDELNFHKYIKRLRNKFSQLFIELLKKQLILQGIVTEEEFNKVKNKINFVWAKDNYYEELKTLEILAARVEAIDSIDDYVGKYFDYKEIHKTILGRTEEEINQFLIDNPQDEGESEEDGDEEETKF